MLTPDMKTPLLKHLAAACDALTIGLGGKNEAMHHLQAAYHELSELADQFPSAVPSPQLIDRWIRQLEEGERDLQAIRGEVMEARQDIKWW